MKVLHINSYFSTSGLFNQLYNRQIQSGIDIDVYVPISYEYPEERLATSGDYTTVHRTFHQFDRYIFHLKHNKILKDLLSTYDFNEFDILHAHSLFSNGWIARQIHKRYNIPYVVAVRNADVRTFFQRMPWLRNMGLDILKNASKIVFISKNTYHEVYNNYIPQSLVNSFQAKTDIIANGIDDFWLNNRYYRQNHSLSQPLRIISVGKVYAGKRFEALAEMVNEYNHIHPTELHIVGPAWNQRITERLKQTPNVIYHGSKSKEELLQMYREMDIFALLSSPETFGLVYPEAMSQGLPVIYTKNEGFDSFFDNHLIGVSVEKTDTRGFTKALDYIIKHYSRVSHNATASIDAFNWQVVSKKYLDIYQELLTKKENE